MRRFLSLTLVLSILAFAAMPVCCAAVGSDATPDAAPELNKGFNFELATTLIVVFCTILLAAILILAILLAKRNIHN